jgi:hypothetical protein
MLFGYVRQELVDPLRNAARWIGFGLLGGLLMMIGYVFVAIGALRLLQSESLPLDGSWSWVPYLAVSLVGLLGVAVTFSRISRRSLNDK